MKKRKFTIKEKSNAPINPTPSGNPKTSDNIFYYVAILLMSLLGLTSSFIIKKRIN